MKFKEKERSKRKQTRFEEKKKFGKRTEYAHQVCQRSMLYTRGICKGSMERH